MVRGAFSRRLGLCFTVSNLLLDQGPSTYRIATAIPGIEQYPQKLFCNMCYKSLKMKLNETKHYNFDLSLRLLSQIILLARSDLV